MTQTSAHIRTLGNTSTAIGWAGERTLTIDRSLAAGGAGLGYSGGDLLLLAVGACYSNDLFREAGLRGIALEQVTLLVQAEWDDAMSYIPQITCTATITSPASDRTIHDLIAHTNRVAEIPAILRRGTQVALQAAMPRTAPATPQADATLAMLTADPNAGSTCAVLTPMIKARLRELAGGQVLEVQVDDPAAHDDIAAWCRLAGHTLLAVINDTPEYTRYFIEKKQ